MAVAADVPNKFDVVINGQGYLFDVSFDPSVIYRKQKATYGFTATFVERSNVSGALGDNQQAFWMTASQNDWSLGDGQKYFRSADASSIRKFSTGVAVDCSIPGQVIVGPSTTANVAVAGIKAIAVAPNNTIYADDVNAYQDTTSLLAHGAGTVQRFGICSDINSGTLYVLGTTRISKYVAGAWSSFSASPVSGTNAGIFYLNNALYGFDDSSLYTWSTTGVLTTIFTWKGATGTSAATVVRAIPYGDKVAILIGYDATGVAGAGEIGTSLSVWTYDGTSTTMVWRLPASLHPRADIAEAFGNIYVAALEPYRSRTSTGAVNTAFARSVVYEFDGSTVALFWRSPNAGGGQPPLLAQHPRGLYIYDQGGVGYYRADIDTGGVYPYADASGLAPDWIVAAPFLGVPGTIVGAARGNVNYHLTNPYTVTTTSGTIETSRFDFESSLKKAFRGVKIDADIPGASTIGIQYRIDEGAYVAVPGAGSITSANVGNEFVFPSGIVGTTIQFKISLNADLALQETPLLRRLYVRAAPIQATFRTNVWILDCTGNKNNPANQNLLRLNDGTTHAKDGLEMATDLFTALNSQTPLTVTDRFGTYTAVIEPSLFELHEMRTGYGRGEFRVFMTVRGT